MDSFVSSVGFEKTFRYIKLIEQGLVVTIMLAACTVGYWRASIFR